MCFSANASFIASSALLVTAFATIKQVSHSRQLPFAIIPFIFGLQQLVEGMLWLGLTDPEMSDWVRPCTIAFLILAQVVWPVWVPFSIFLLEKRSLGKKILFFLIIVGGVVAIYLFYCITKFPIKAVINAHHIDYQLDFPHINYKLMGVFYFFAAVLPPFISGAGKNMKLLGVTILASFLTSKIFFAEHVVSVWCFFAAIFSVIVFFILRDLKNKTQTP